MIVTFGIAPRPPVPVTGEPVPLVDEAEVPGWLEANIATLPPGDDLEGWLRIGVEGGAEAVLFDTLGPLMQYVCIIAPTRLLASGEYTVSLYSVDAEYAFAVQGEDVAIDGPGVADLRIARKLLLPALADCAVRYVAAMRPVQDRVEDLRDHLDTTESGARRCLDALQKAGLATAPA